jgi:hyperosmotically inducible periplasmic protein
MKTAILVALAGALAASGCEYEASDPRPPEAASAPADDTREEELLDHEAGGRNFDRTITQRIRRTLMRDDTLSTTAKNCKIITSAGVVTLRGAVSSETEQANVRAIAEQTSNVKWVRDLLQVGPD